MESTVVERAKDWFFKPKSNRTGITNKYNLPEALVRAIENDGYTKGDCDYSVTELLRPARINALTALHRDQIVEDASDRIWSLLGQSIHVILERANDSDIAEKRFFAKYGDKIVSAQIDSLSSKEGILTDYKVSTLYKFNKSEADPDFVTQLNMQADILRKNGIDVKALRIVGIIRNWSKPEYKRETKAGRFYPPAQVVTQEVEMWSPKTVEAYIMMRIAEHEKAKVDLPLCSPDEQWVRNSAWKVMNKQGTRAINGGGNFQTEDEAQAFYQKNLKSASGVKFVEGARGRCEDYCSVREFCEQYKIESKTTGDGGDEV